MIFFATTLLILLSLCSPAICVAQEIKLPMDGSPQEEFVYRLPYAKRVVAVAVQQSAIAAHHYNEDNLVRFSCWQFSWQDEKGDVYAARQGVVSNTREYVEVLHADGTASRYTGLDYGSLRVMEGDKVMPDTIIGKAMKEDEGNYSLLFELYYLVSRPEGHRTKAPYLRRYINPTFSTTRGNMQLQEGKSYKAKANKKLIEKEK